MLVFENHSCGGFRFVCSANVLSFIYSGQATDKIQELLQEDQEVKARRERCQKQAAALAKLTRQLSMHEARASMAAGGSDSCKFLRPL